MLPVHLCVPSAKGGQKRVSEPLKLEVQEVGNHQELATELWSSTRVVYTLNHLPVLGWASSVWRKYRAALYGPWRGLRTPRLFLV